MPSAVLMPHGMRHQNAHGAGDRRADNIAVGVNGATLTHHLGSEDGVGHVAHLDRATRDGGAQHAGGVVRLDAGRLGGRLRGGLLLEDVKESHGILLCVA